MSLFLRPAVAVSLLIALAVPGRAGASSDVLARAVALNGGLQSFTATLHADVNLHAFLPLSASLDGTTYYREPNLYKVSITSGMPAMAQQFDRLYPRIVTPAHWEATYVVTVGSDNGGQTAVKLVPRTQGNIESIDATLDDASGGVTAMRWNYRNGGWASMTQTLSTVSGFLLPVKQQGHVQEPGYVADISSTLSAYHVNVPIADSVFQQQ
ncbi:MAG: hypothetical protein ACLQPV_01365 [Vulcanimicrobiaceae bacterium]